MNCKVCGEHLFKQLDWRSLFLTTSRIHSTCRTVLDKESNVEIIPIQDNIIYFESFFTRNVTINIEFVLPFLELTVIMKYLKEENWSILYFYDEEEYNKLNDETKYLFLHLGQEPYVFISTFEY